MTRFLVSAAHKSSGKTTVSVGLCAAFARDGLKVQPFKKGPDYIDPMWLARAAGRPCRNLDFYTQSPEEIVGDFGHAMADADVAVVEGNKGLYDGMDPAGSDSTAALARLLGLPVILVIDTQGITRGVAPLILGYQSFHPHVEIAGVILNKVASDRHEGKLHAAVGHYTDVPVLGAVHRNRNLEIVERHIGLMPTNEDEGADGRVAAIADHIAGHVDIELLTKVVCTAPANVDAPPVHPVSSTVSAGSPIRIGIPRDAAFGFYYAGDLEALEAAGAELVIFDALHDARLPSVDGLFISGGFPEMKMTELEANADMRRDIAAAVENGLPVYAECGGLMYLARRITWRGTTSAMVGAIAADVQMQDRPVGRGYVRLEETGAGPWPLTAEDGQDVEFPAHEFHYSRLENLDPSLEFAYKVRRGTGIDGANDGIVYRNVLASYAHLRDVGGNRWAERFVAFVRHCKENGGG